MFLKEKVDKTLRFEVFIDVNIGVSVKLTNIFSSVSLDTQGG